MIELLSVLILSYAVPGDIHESEITMRHDQCVAAEKAVSRALLGPRDGMPTVELLSGYRVPVLDVHCLPACMADGEPLKLLKDEEA